MSESGIKIKNISAAMLYEMQLGIRDYFTGADAMLSNSLFSQYLMRNGLSVYKNKKQAKGKAGRESTRDIICLDFDFGSPSYEEEYKRLTKRLEGDLSPETRERIEAALKKVNAKKELYSEKKRSEIREQFYNEGVDITYKTAGRDGSFQMEETLHYKMLFRTSAKAKLGQVIFIRDALYEKAYDWLTIGLGNKMSQENARIVELSAYAPLTTSTIIGTLHIPVEDILILKDQDSYFQTLVNVVRAEIYTDKNGLSGKKCVVSQEETEVKNTVWDGMGIIESALLPDWVKGMALLRNHLFKMCGLRGHIQLFFRDWCEKKGYDYETFQIEDMFGCRHFVKDIKMITTDNAVKWKKFTDLMGGSPKSAYAYWCSRIRQDGNIWGIVKTDHPSKLGDHQQLSYQMVNTLPCTKEDVHAIAQTSIDYVEKLKTDNDAFEQFLRKQANEINHYEMLADLYAHNHAFGNCKWFREEKKKIIFHYVSHLRKGKILVNGDNLTVFGNPYGLLLYAVGEDWKRDPSLHREKGCVQCCTTRFANGAYLAAFRNPHNAPNNICYMHNVCSPELNRYFSFSPNIAAINCIETDIQDRANGMDEDSDFMLFTDHPAIVSCARYCYEAYPTIVNALQESGITYCNTKTDYARMDHKFSASKMGIGRASNLAQLAMTYYWTEKAKKAPDPEVLKQLYDSFIILSVLAQIIIDGCKREYEIHAEGEINRISRLPCMTFKKETGAYTKTGRPKKIKCDLPVFMKYTREIKYTKDGRELPWEETLDQKNRLQQRINYNLQCPMNWLEECLDLIPGGTTANTLPTERFFIKMEGKANDKQMSKIMALITDYDNCIKNARMTCGDKEDAYLSAVLEKSEEVLNTLGKIKMKNPYTVNRLIEVALGLSTEKGASARRKYDPAKYTRKVLNLLYKTDKERFLKNFTDN